MLVGAHIPGIEQGEASDAQIDEGRERAVEEEIVCAEENGKGREMVLLMMTVADAGSYAEAFVEELLVQVVNRKAPVAMFANALRIRRIEDVQATLFRLKRGLSLYCHGDEG